MINITYQSHQLYAKIKRSSKYYGQNSYAKQYSEFPFPVQIEPMWMRDKIDGGCVRGGPGGNYRLSDVNLFIKENGKEFRIK